jgi:N6-L-threonylcarbamoyladenine synthase
LYTVRRWDRIAEIGATRDDACGEAFDKVAKMLSLGYPGGPVIEKCALKGEPVIPFGCSATKEAYDFSFSGLKTAVRYYLDRHRHCTLGMKADICASFQEAAFKVLVHKSLDACRAYRLKTLLVGGGVAANQTLRRKLTRAAEAAGVTVYFPSLELCMDNAAMVAGYGYQLYKAGVRGNAYLAPC